MREATKRQRPRPGPFRLLHDPELLRTRIRRAGYRQCQFAALVGISEGFLSDMLSGRRNAGAPIMKVIADALGCSIEDLEHKDEDQRVAS